MYQDLWTAAKGMYKRGVAAASTSATWIPATINREEWRAHEKDGWKVVPRAGETLFRLKQTGTVAAD
jgi:hypothetical protein